MSSILLLENKKGQRLLTAEDLALFPKELPSGPVR